MKNIICKIKKSYEINEYLKEPRNWNNMRTGEKIFCSCYFRRFVTLFFSERVKTFYGRVKTFYGLYESPLHY